MSRPRVFEKPLGMRDWLPDELAKRRRIEARVLRRMAAWGYREIETPTLEYDETVGKASATADDQRFTLFDRQGLSLVLRPDMTAPIARVVGSLLADVPLPLRLCYRASVFRRQRKEAGRSAEFPQIGVELVGDGSADADAEVIALAVDCLRAAEVARFSLAVGHMGFLTELLQVTVPEAVLRDELKRLLARRDFVGFRQAVGRSTLPDAAKERLLALLSLRGGVETLEEAARVAAGVGCGAALDTLRRLWDVLEAYGVAAHVVFDLTLIGHLGYYTGVLFEGYAADHGFPILHGGRYDHLMALFARPAPATGFALVLDRVWEVSALAPEPGPPTVMVVYDDAHRTEALQTARRLRDEGNVVVTCWVPDADAADRAAERAGGRVLCFVDKGPAACGPKTGREAP